MKTISIYKPGLRYLLILFALFGFTFSTTLAQENLPSRDEKAKQKTMHVKVIKKDKDGTITKIDTIYGDNKLSHDSVIVKRHGKKLEPKELEKMLKDLEITLDFNLDSLDSLGKVISAIVCTDDFSKPCDFETFKFGFNDEDNDPEVIDMDSDDWNNTVNAHGKMFCMPQPPDPQGWGQGYTPWGKIREIKVKDKKRGKKIVIRTEDADSYSYFPIPPMPPIPPVPPASGQHPKVKKGVKKIIIEKNTDEK